MIDTEWNINLKASKYEEMKLECNLMIFHRIDCPCSDYWARNGQALIPEILDRAWAKMIDPLEYFANYARDVHSRHVDEGVIFT